MNKAGLYIALGNVSGVLDCLQCDLKGTGPLALSGNEFKAVAKVYAKALEQARNELKEYIDKDFEELRNRVSGATNSGAITAEPIADLRDAE